MFRHPVSTNENTPKYVEKHQVKKKQITLKHCEYQQT